MTPLHPARGFTLIEMVMTIVIAALGAVLLFSTFGTVLSNAHRPAERLQAEFLAREWAEESLAAGYGNVTAASEGAITGFTGFTRDRTVAAGSAGCPSTGALCQQVEITVAVNGATAARQSVLLMAPPP